jgi:hypothetical protein
MRDPAIAGVISHGRDRFFEIHETFTMTASIPPFELVYDDQRRLILKRPGQEDVPDARVRRAFPWSKPEQYVSIRNSEGKELILIENLADLDAARRGVIEAELARGSFIPRIMKIDQVIVSFGRQEWAVQTDRGPAKFRVQEREDIRFLNDGRFRIKDADGNVYEMAAFDDLDPYSQRQLEPLI